MVSPEKAQFFERMDNMELALTYDDVTMRTRFRKEPLPDEIDITSKFSENIELKVPFVSAAMDTVTGSDMAIEMAKLGGLGVIPASLSIEDQYKEVRRVKKASHDLIDDPISVHESDTLEEVEKMRARKRFTFRTFTVINSEGKLVGVLTGKDFDYPESKQIRVGKAMRPLDQVTSAPVTTSLQEAYDLMQRGKINTLPLLKEDGSVGGMYLWSDVERNVRELGKYNVDANHQLRVAAAISTGKDTLERVEALSKFADVFVIDTADGDSYYVFKTVKDVKKHDRDLELVAGNISDGASAFELAEAGTNGVKTGQSPGAACSTSRETGIGMPQITAVYDCVRALGKRYSHIPVCADGGIKNHGDIPKAFAAGAHSVMMGRMLAGTTEAPGVPTTLQSGPKKGSRVKGYRGMGSASALADNEASRERYGAKGTVFLPEGEEGFVPYEGDLKDTIQLCVLALRKGMRYTKSPNLQYHRENTSFKRRTMAGALESNPHDMDIA